MMNTETQTTEVETMLTNNQINALAIFDKLERPCVEWNQLHAELLAGGNATELVKDLEKVAERAARLARYLDERNGNGCGDQGHKAAVKAQNRAGRIVHEKAFGYNATHDINF